ncbi:MAG: hypothetical protein ACJ708_12820 [Nitrososphaeraceae archaeon]
MTYHEAVFWITVIEFLLLFHAGLVPNKNKDSISGKAYLTLPDHFDYDF